MNEEIIYADAHELAQRIRDRELSPVEVVQAHLDRIDAINPRLNALIAYPDGVMDRAREAEAAAVRGENWGPLHGVPFTVKDCVDTEGVRTTRGSMLFEDYVPAADATVVKRLKDAGGIFIAKSNMPEFALWWETDNVGLRPHRKPLDDRPDPRWVQWRRGFGHRFRNVPPGYRERRRRLHSRARQLLRHSRAESHPRAHTIDWPLARGPVALHARGAVGAFGQGRSSGVEPDGGPRRTGPFRCAGPGARSVGP